MGALDQIKITFAALTICCLCSVVYADNNSLNEEQWLNSDKAVVKKQPVKKTPIIKPHESSFVEKKIPESEQYLSDEEIAKLEHARLMNKHFYNVPNKKYFPRITTNIKIGHPRHILRPQLLVPLNQTPLKLTYFNFITMIDTVTNFEVNSSIGFRKLEDYFILGTYIFHDYRLTKHNNSVNQLTLGVEYLCEDREARINFYIPFKTKFLIATEHYVEATFRGPQTIVRNLGDSSYEVVRPGFDVEVGGGLSKNSSLSLYFKPFFFYHADFKNIYGLSIRTSFKLNTMVSFDAEFTYDNQRKFAGFGGITFNWMFGGKQVQKLSSLEIKMTQMPIRDIDAITTVNTRIGQEFSSQTFDGKNAVINSNKKSSGNAMYSSVHKLNHAPDRINNILILDGNGTKGIENMSDDELKNIVGLATLGQHKIQPLGAIDNCISDSNDTRLEVLHLNQNMDVNTLVAARREEAKRKLKVLAAQTKTTINIQLTQLQERMNKLRELRDQL